MRRLQDPNSNRIAQWNNETALLGVYQGQLKLSDEPPLGDWTIEVNYEVGGH